MTEAELLTAISNGWIKNELQKFVTPETIRESGCEHDCPAARAHAWRKYVEAMRDIPAPTGVRPST